MRLRMQVDLRLLGLLRRFTFEWPVFDAAFLAGVLRWLMLVVIAAGLYWAMFGLRPRDKRGAEDLKSEV